MFSAFPFSLGSGLHDLLAKYRVKLCELIKRACAEQRRAEVNFLIDGLDLGLHVLLFQLLTRAVAPGKVQKALPRS